MRRHLLAVAVVAALAGCGGSGGGGGPRTARPASTAPPTSGSTAAPTTATPSAPATSSTPPKGTGGTSTQTGFVTRTVTTAAQPGLAPIQVAYKLYVPTSYDRTKATPLVVSALTPATLWQPIAEAQGFIVAEQQGYLMNGGFTFDYDPLVLDGILQDAGATWNVDPKRIYLTGFSAGAHWSYAVGLANANVFAALGICSGSIGIAIQTGVWIQDSATQPNVARPIPVGIRQRLQDTVVPPFAGTFSRDQLLKAGFPVDYAELAGGHTVDTPELQGLWDYLKNQSLP